MTDAAAVPESPSAAAPERRPRTAERNPLRVSVVICCHNSSARLEPTLKHLAAQTGLSRDRWEVLLVDNASSDPTVAKALRFWQDLGAPADFRIVAEPRLGLIHARIAGISRARHEILSFVDDDNWVCPDWCATLLDLMTAFPDLGVIGGRGEAAFALGQTVPEWFAALGHGYAVGPQAARSGRIEAPLARFYGAGLTVRRSALQALFASGFSPLCTGRTGTRLAAGEDTELCYALAMKGWRFWYEDNLRFSHFIPPARLEEPYARRMFHGLGFTSAIEDYYFRAAPGAAPRTFVARAKRLDPVRRANAVRNLMRHRLRALRSPAESPARAQARIEASFFEGRLEGLRDCRRNSRAILAHIARWAHRAADANAGARAP
jgi:glycosyltransferase involved in cell wall biosynthesis